MTFSLTEINQSEVFDSGGWELVINGVFEPKNRYNVFIGDYKNNNDAICYSGIFDQGNIIYPELNNVLYAYTPLLNISGENPYSVTVLNVDTLESRTLLDCLYVRKRQYHSKVYEYKRNLIPNYKLGPINITEEN